MKTPVKIGFDLDGVVLYNPARIIRRPVTTFKHFFLPKQEDRFYVPQSPFMRHIWHLLHLSSFRVAPGFHEIAKLAEKGTIEPYIITARYGFLRPGFMKWMHKLNVPETFKGYYMNENNDQPHEFKERMIKKLNLDMFVEDNLNIVRHLNQTTDATVFWIYNIFDRDVKYEHKHPGLENALKEIKQYVSDEQQTDK